MFLHDINMQPAPAGVDFPRSGCLALISQFDPENTLFSVSFNYLIFHGTYNLHRFHISNTQ